MFSAGNENLSINLFLNQMNSDMKAVLEFLTELRQNNNREWFTANRSRYETCRDKFLFITEVLINEIRKFDPEVPAMDPKDCLFRINRDVRFSADKSPYKTNFGSYISRGGKKSVRAGYYFHVDPQGSFAGGGIYMPAPDVLKALRTAIYEHPEDYLAIVNDPGFRRYFSEFSSEMLKTAPKGFPADFEYIELLRRKSYSFGTEIDREALLRGDFVEKLVDAFRELYKMNHFLNEALDNYL